MISAQNKFCNLSGLLSGSGLSAFSIHPSPPPSVAMAMCLWAEYQGFFFGLCYCKMGYSRVKWLKILFVVEFY